MLLRSSARFLHVAVQTGDVESVQALVTAGANVNAHYPVECAKCKGMDKPNCPQCHGYKKEQITPLRLATDQGHNAVAAILRKAKAT